MIPIPILLQQQQRHAPQPWTESAIAFRWGADYRIPNSPAVTDLLRAARQAVTPWLTDAVLKSARTYKTAIDGGFATNPAAFLIWAMREQPAIVYGLILLYPSYCVDQLHLNASEVESIAKVFALLNTKLVALLTNNKTDYAKLYEHINRRH